MDENLRECLLSILQRGITEARSQALSGETRRAAALLDALDNIPRHLAYWADSSESEIASQLKVFMDANPDHATDFVWMLSNRVITV